MSESIRSVLSRNLRDLRKERGFTQDQLASMAGFQGPSYNRWESGKSWPEPDTIAALAIALGVRESRLFLDTNSNTSPREALKVLTDLVNSLDQ